MTATLTYYNDQDKPLVTFKLLSQITIVGRRPQEVSDFPEVIEKVNLRKPFQVQMDNTLFIGIPSDMKLARNHFEIRRTTDKLGEVVFVIRDMESHCGIYVNHARNKGSAPIQLNNGDCIGYGFKFVFRLE